MADFGSNIFRYGAHRYKFIAEVYSIDKISEVTPLNNEQIEYFEYVNALNNLYIVGQLVYEDKFGHIGNMLNKFESYCEVLIEDERERFDGNTAIELGVNYQFKHKFIINNIQILGRSENNYIRYALDLVSENWFNCVKNLSYSNYNTNPETTVELFKQFIGDSGLKLGKTFDVSNSTAKYNYITKNNDSLLNIFPWLCNKLYYDDANKDGSVKFFFYHENRDTYEVFDLANKETYGSYDGIFPIGMFQAETEEFATVEKINIASITSVPRINFYDSLMTRKVCTYSYEDNTFGDFVNNNTDIQNYYNKMYLNEELDNKINMKTSILSNYKRYECDWDSQINIYSDQVDNLLYNDGLILEVDGDLFRYPSDILTVSIDNPLLDGSESKSSLEDIKQRYYQYKGDWIISKVRHHIVPSPNTNVAKYRQNLCLFRNYNIPYK